MKKVLLVTLSLLMLILCACHRSEPGQTDPTETTVPTQIAAPTQTTTPIKPTQTEPPTTEPQPTQTEPVETTQPVETVSYNLAVEDWYVEPEYLSYEKYFSKDRAYLGGGSSWLKMDGNVGKKYCVRWDDAGLAVYSDLTGEAYLVPDSLNYNCYEIVGADGKFVYLSMNKEFGKLNLDTGEYTPLMMSEEILHAVTYDNLVTYYIAFCWTDGKQFFEVGRVYLPDGHKDVLDTFSTENIIWNSLYLNKVYSNHGEVKWTMTNPDFVEILEKELSNPDSAFKISYYDNSEYWEAENGVELLYDNGYYMLLDEIEDAYDARAQLMGIFNQKTGKYSEKKGILDTCWYGSGYPHDHFNPDVTTASAPNVILGKWKNIDANVRFELCKEMVDDEDSSEVTIEGYTDYASDCYLYVESEGIYKQVLDIPVKMWVDTGSCILCVTSDNCLLAISYDGEEIANIYQASKDKITILKVGRYCNKVMFLEGDTVLEIDLVNKCYRKVVSHENIIRMYYDTDYVDGVNIQKNIYFEVSVGLFIEGYVLDLESGALTAHYRL